MYYAPTLPCRSLDNLRWWSFGAWGGGFQKQLTQEGALMASSGTLAAPTISGGVGGARGSRSVGTKVPASHTTKAHLRLRR